MDRRSTHHRFAAPVVSLVGLLVVLSLGACGSSVAPSPAASSALLDATPTDLPTPTPTPSPSPTPTPSPSPEPTPTPTASPVLGLIPPCPGKTPAGHPIGAATSDQSTNWSGIVGTAAAGRFTCVEATWLQPLIRCHGTKTQSATYWVGLGGYNETGLVQIGTESTCVNGRAQTAAWRESLPRQRFSVRLGLAIRPGHKIRAQIRWLGGSRYRLILVDVSNGQHASFDDANASLRRTSAEWIAEAPTGGCPKSCHILKMPEFGTLNFLDAWATIAGRRVPLDGYGFTHVTMTMETSGGTIRSQVTTLAPSGTSVSIRWRHT